MGMAIAKGRGILKLLALSAQVYPLLKAQGLAVSGGILLVGETREACDACVETLQGIKAVKVSFKRGEEAKWRNYQMYFVAHTRWTKIDQILEFVEDDGSLRVVVANGIAQEQLEDLFLGRTIVLSEGDMGMEAGEEFPVDEVVQYIRLSASVVYRELRLFAKHLKDSGQWETETTVSKMLKATAMIWLLFYCETHTEEQTSYERQRIFEHIDYVVSISEQGSALDGIAENVASMLQKYVVSHADVVLGRADCVESELFKAIQRRTGIVEKGEFYYVSETLLKRACKEVEDDVSFLTIKRELAEEGYLVINGRGEGNYTTKLLLTNAFGYTFRVRFLKLRKELFENTTSLGLGKEI